MKVSFRDNLDASQTFTSTDVAANALLAGLSGYNPDGPKWDCTITVNRWNASTGANVQHLIYVSGANDATITLPAWVRALMATQTTVPTATGHVRIQLTMQGAAIGRYFYLFTN